MKALFRIDEVLEVMEFSEQATTRDVENLITQREMARQAQDFKTADRLREEIENQGYLVDDTPAGPRVRKI